MELLNDNGESMFNEEWSDEESSEEEADEECSEDELDNELGSVFLIPCSLHGE